MIMETRRKALARLRPPPKTNLADWMEQHVNLPVGGAGIPGPIRLYEFQHGIADAISDPSIERVTVLKSARIGYTTLLVGMLGSYVANDPSAILAVTPTEGDARTLVVQKTEPVFAASPALSGLLTDTGSKRRSRNTMMSRRFPGGSLTVVAAKSPRNLRAHDARILIMDEIDAMSTTVEGSPIDLAEKRTMTFDDRKIVIGSTPANTETSLVLRAYALSDQRVFEIKCPHCGEWHEIKWADIQWPDGRPAEAFWACPSCGGIVEHAAKDALVAAGRWRITRPEVQGHAGFKINSLVSPVKNAAWGRLAAEFLEAKDDPSRLQVFVNTILGEGWNGDGEEIDGAALQARAERFDIEMVPEAVLAITAGVDVQRDRIEITFIGWDRHGNAYVLGHVVVWGDPLDNESWRQVDEQLKLRFPHPYGGRLGVDASAIDAGDGYSMEIVLRFAASRAGRRVYAIKGDDGNRPWIMRSKTPTKRGWLFIVGVDGVKTHLAQLLSRPNLIRFSDTLEPVWYEQLTAERRVVRMSRGQPHHRFERIPGRAAEALDCVVYAFAVKRLVTVNWDAREEQMQVPEIAVVARKRPRIIQSSWMEGFT